MGFDFSQSSLSSGDGIAVERGESMGEGEGGKVKRVGMSKYWDASQSQGDVEDEGEGESEGTEEPRCVRLGECLGHFKCYNPDWPCFKDCCFIEERADAKNDVGSDWSEGSDWGLDGDETAWRAKYGSPKFRYSKNNGRRPSGRFRRGGKPRWKRKLCRESEGEEGVPSGPVLVSDWAVGEDHERLQSVFGWSF